MSEAPATSYDLAGKRVWVAGHRGMVGAALVRRLATESCDVLTVGRCEVDLRRQAETEAWLAEARPQAVFLAAATVGGILASDRRPAEFLYDNLAIATNVIEGAHRAGVEKLLFVASASIYPTLAAQPIGEDALLTGPLEPANQWYAIAKIVGIKLVQACRRQWGCDFISIVPINLYGPGDNFDPLSAHVAAALMRKCHEAKLNGCDTIEIWGTGTPRREFLYVDDLADAAVHLMQVYSHEDPINVGSGADLTIRELAERIAGVVGFAGRFRFDAGKPDGTPRKLLDVGRLAALGWRARTSLADGLAATYAWYRAQAS